MNVLKQPSKGDSVRQSLIARGVLSPGSSPVKTSTCVTIFRDKEGKETGRCERQFEQLAKDTWTICPRCSHPQLHRDEVDA